MASATGVQGRGWLLALDDQAEQSKTRQCLPDPLSMVAAPGWSALGQQPCWGFPLGTLICCSFLSFLPPPRDEEKEAETGARLSPNRVLWTP